MKRFLFILLAFFATLAASAQPSAKDTSEVTEGVIVVKKQIKATNAGSGSSSINAPDNFHDQFMAKQPQPITPFVKVEYSLFLSSVKEVTIMREANGQEYRDKIPVFDSSIYSNQKIECVYPQKSSSLARYFSDNISYKYKPADSLRSDTIVVGLWITPTGKIKWAQADTSPAIPVPKEIQNELAAAAYELREWGWGKGGGFNTKRRFLKPSQFVSESYYCELYVIVSGKPLTVEQKNTGIKFAPFDVPLNSPPADLEHRNSIEKNKKKN